MSKLFLTVVASILVFQSFAQDSTSDQRINKRNAKKDRINNLLRMEEEGDLIFNKHSIFGIRLATDGYGISYEKGKFKKPGRTLLYAFELNEKKSVKEHHISTSTNGFDFSSVVPYKLNNFYELKASIGQEVLIGGKGNKNGVSVTAIYGAGLTLGLLKPYYLDVQEPGSESTTRMTFDQLMKDTTGATLIGSSGFTTGWGHLKFKPGINAKQAMRFDYGRLNQTVSAIEAGLTEEFFVQKIPQVYLVPQKQFFFNAYVTILFGNRK